MNEEVILSMVKPYVKNNSLLCSDFIRLFDMLSIREQGAVSEILENNGITVLSVPDEEAPESGTFEVLYDSSIFADGLKESEAGKIRKDNSYLRINKKVNQSNEILCVLIQKGNMQAKQDICTANYRLVYKEVGKYSRYFGHDLEFDELVQAGMMGILKAAEKFDVTKGFQFTTYALYWIRQSIMREIGDYGFTIRLPIHMLERITKIVGLEKKHEMQGLNYFECIEEISKEIGRSREDVEYCLLLKANFLNDVSLDIPVGEKRDTTLMEFLPNEEEQSTESVIEELELKRVINDILNTLPPREKKIITLRFGLNGEEPHTLEAIGQEFHVTRERIRQLEKKAIQKIKHHFCSSKIKDFVDGRGRYGE